MKKLLAFFCCIISACAYGQSQVNTFHVVDNETLKPVPATSVTIVRAKLSINTEPDGVFIIPGDIGKMRDTVILYAQSYTLLKMQLAKLNGMDTIRLSKLGAKAVTVPLKYQYDTVLNVYNKLDIRHYAGIHTETARFDYLQLAQRFEVQKSGLFLKSVTLHRLSFNVDYFDSYGLSELEGTKFRLHIYDVDGATKGPGAELCDQMIEVKSGDSKQASVNLKNYNIIIPGKTFFVAIEWLRDYYNAGYSIVYDKRSRQEVQLINYRPTIGISPITGDKLNIWAMNFKREWKPYTYFMPFGTDLALKAVVAY